MPSDVELAVEIVTSHLGIEKERLQVDHQSPDGWNALRSQIANIVAKWLEENPERLMRAIYRIDVAEEQFRAACVGSNFNEMGTRIADLILERELVRIRMRQAYFKRLDNSTGG